MLIERKTISIFAYEFEPTVAITFNVDKEGTVECLQFWVRKDYKYNYSILRRILDVASQLEIIAISNPIIQKDVFQAYQKSFDMEILTTNYYLKTDNFNTKKISKNMKPHRNFIKTSKQNINIFIKNYIEKGEIK